MTPQVLASVPPQPTLTGCALYESYINKYEWDKSVARAIMHAESNCNTNAVGDTWVIGGIYAPSCGLFQVRTISPARGTCEQLKDPAFNIEKAHLVYLSQGWSAWSVFNSGIYKKYL